MPLLARKIQPDPMDRGLMEVLGKFEEGLRVFNAHVVDDRTLFPYSNEEPRRAINLRFG